MSKESLQYAGEYTLKKLQLISADFTKSIDLTGIAVEINIFENIFMIKI